MRFSVNMIFKFQSNSEVQLNKFLQLNYINTAYFWNHSASSRFGEFDKSQK